MGAEAGSIANEEVRPARSLWSDAFRRLRRDRLAVLCLLVVLAYAAAALLAQFGWIASPWEQEVGKAFAPPSFDRLELIMGTDFLGRSVLYKVVHGARVAMSVGLLASLISVPIGVLLGATAGYFGGWWDDAVVWFYTTVASIPGIMLLIAITLMLGKGMTAMCIALGATSWVHLARVMRGEFMKHKSREYVVAAESLGAGHSARIFRHIFPNVSHFVIINFSIQFMGAIKAEVILSFLGIGAQGLPSWGVMISDAKDELSRWVFWPWLNGTTPVWWQLAGATSAMFFVVLALNILGDALRDALDPRIK
ncbi:MAG: ABC transporter permease [Oligoflexia bacterium]|nr:ABC transporter permease [Oligoflexia bacterium]